MTVQNSPIVQIETVEGPVSVNPMLIDFDGQLLTENGQRQVIEYVQKHHRARLFNHANRMLGDETLAEDMVGESFAKLVANLSKFEGRSTLATWLYKVLTNCCIDAARRRRRQEYNTVSLDDPIEDEESPLMRELSAPPDEESSFQVMRQELGDKIFRFCQTKLSRKLRKPLWLCDIDGFNYEEIAQILGIPLGTVKSRIFNARAQLRTEFEKDPLYKEWMHHRG